MLGSGNRKSVGGIDGIRARSRVAMQLLQQGQTVRVSVRGDDLTVLGAQELSAARSALTTNEKSRTVRALTQCS